MAQRIAEAVRRARDVLQHHPQRGLHDDMPAISHWQHDTRVVSGDAHGTQVLTDIPRELGGSGDQVTPGWLFRAGVASCLATSIAMNAAAEGVELTLLEVTVSSRTDARGILGMKGQDGEQVFAGPCDMQWRVRINARDASPARLCDLVERSRRCSPISCAVENMVRVHMQIDTAAH
ncbi:OsmC family peroxiredoxin [Dyella monticola]|uniref:OsmC family peroxiredoxin n=2 Tax=Dyella monticola TaxID=1927958 RepID=A0A370XA53_9GAMM|nr:OsmC family peroxiredoxin [Dyella monticola]